MLFCWLWDTNVGSLQSSMGRSDVSKNNCFLFLVLPTVPFSTEVNWSEIRDVFKILKAFGELSATTDVFLTSLPSATVDLGFLFLILVCGGILAQMLYNYSTV